MLEFIGHLAGAELIYTYAVMCAAVPESLTGRRNQRVPLGAAHW